MYGIRRPASLSATQRYTKPPSVIVWYKKLEKIELLAERLPT